MPEGLKLLCGTIGLLNTAFHDGQIFRGPRDARATLKLVMMRIPLDNHD